MSALAEMSLFPPLQAEKEQEQGRAGSALLPPCNQKSQGREGLAAGAVLFQGIGICELQSQR